MITTRDQYAIYDNEVGRLLEVGDYTDLDMGSLSTYDGPITFSQRPDSSDDDLLECLPRERGRYKVVRIKVEIIEEVGDLLDILNEDANDDGGC